MKQLRMSEVCTRCTFNRRFFLFRPLPFPPSKQGPEPQLPACFPLSLINCRKPLFLSLTDSNDVFYFHVFMNCFCFSPFSLSLSLSLSPSPSLSLSLSLSLSPSLPPSLSLSLSLSFPLHIFSHPLVHSAHVWVIILGMWLLFSFVFRYASSIRPTCLCHYSVYVRIQKSFLANPLCNFAKMDKTITVFIYIYCSVCTIRVFCEKL